MSKCHIVRNYMSWLNYVLRSQKSRLIKKAILSKTQHMFWLRDMKNAFLLRSLKQKHVYIIQIHYPNFVGLSIAQLICDVRKRTRFISKYCFQLPKTVF